MFGPKGPFCQSCGMPLSKDPEGGGSERDGGRSGEYCSHCYRDGEFTEPDLTVTEMVEKVQAKMKSMHLPGFLARSFTRNIPNLKRWKIVAPAAPSATSTRHV
jgi:Putative zinc ribbon domain